MFAVPLLSKAFRAIAGAITPSEQRVSRQKLEIPSAIEHEVMDSFLGSNVIHYEILEPKHSVAAPVHPDHATAHHNSLHAFWLRRLPTAKPS